MLCRFDNDRFVTAIANVRGEQLEMLWHFANDSFYNVNLLNLLHSFILEQTIFICNDQTKETEVL